GHDVAVAGVAEDDAQRAAADVHRREGLEGDAAVAWARRGRTLIDQYRLQQRRAVVDAEARVGGVIAVGVPRRLDLVVAGIQAVPLPVGVVGAVAGVLVPQIAAVAEGPGQPAGAGLGVSRVGVIHDDGAGHRDRLRRLRDVVVLVRFRDRR